MEKKIIFPTKRNVVVVGPRKSGKRTLINRLFKLFVETARERANPEPAYGYDGLLADLDKDLPLESIKIRINTMKYYIDVDHSVGHRRFVRSLAKQTAPDVAFFVVSAVAEEFEASRKDMVDQLNIISHFGVKNVIVLVTKMDLLHYDPGRFSETQAIIESTIQYHKMRFKFVKYVPVSGTTAVNLASKSPLTEWYPGLAFIDLIDTIPKVISEESLPMRFSIEEVYKIAGIGYIGTGRLATGRLTSGDLVVVAPDMFTTDVKAIENHHDELSVTAGTSIGLNLGSQRGKDMKKGQLVGLALNSPPQAVKDFTVLLYVNKLPNLFVMEQVHEVKCHNASVRCKIIELIGQVDAMYGTTSTIHDEKIEANGYIIVKFEAVDPVSLELYSEYKDLGKVVIQDTDGLVASGIVIHLTNLVKLPSEKES